MSKSIESGVPERKKAVETIRIVKSPNELSHHEREWYEQIGKDVVRVQGGWIYSDWDSEKDRPFNAVFVPKT
tara:strand:- start:1188 stop:1403 length:216 start_codon:yes stop_codon:yes gene_type:complete